MRGRQIFNLLNTISLHIRTKWVSVNRGGIFLFRKIHLFFTWEVPSRMLKKSRLHLISHT